DPKAPVSLPHDLPRGGSGSAIIADPRNDENLIIAQLHVAMIRFHNEVAAKLKRSTAPSDPFDQARRLVAWHYQFIVLTDVLPRPMDKAVLGRVPRAGSMLTRLCAARGCGPFMPVEFSAAAYRFGHSMINADYDYNRVFHS